MCIECGCGMDSVGSMIGMTSVNITDSTSQGAAGLTLDMTATPAQRESFIEEDPIHELREGTEDPD
jgi:hypothetical protein